LAYGVITSSDTPELLRKGKRVRREGKRRENGSELFVGNWKIVLTRFPVRFGESN